MTIVAQTPDTDPFPPRTVISVERWDSEHRDWLDTKHFPLPDRGYVAVRRTAGVLEYVYWSVATETPEECAEKAALVAELLDADLYLGPNPAPEDLDGPYERRFDAMRDEYETSQR